MAQPSVSSAPIVSVWAARKRRPRPRDGRCESSLPSEKEEGARKRLRGRGGVEASLRDLALSWPFGRHYQPASIEGSHKSLLDFRIFETGFLEPTPR